MLGLSKTSSVNKSLRAAEKVVSRLAQDWNYLEDGSRPPFPNPGGITTTGNDSLLRKVGYLHKCLMRYEHLKYLCWKVIIMKAKKVL